MLDEGIGIQSLQKAIQDEGITCELLIDHFPRGTPDSDWLPKVGRNGWFLLTKDRAIQKNSIEYESLMNASLGAFFLVSSNISGKEITSCVIKAIPKMMKIIKSQQKPFLAKIYKDGSVTLWKKPGT